MLDWPDFFDEKNLPSIAAVGGGLLLSLAALQRIGTWIILDARSRKITAWTGLGFLLLGVGIVLVKWREATVEVRYAFILRDPASTSGGAPCSEGLNFQVGFTTNGKTRVFYRIQVPGQPLDSGLTATQVDDSFTGNSPVKIQIRNSIDIKSRVARLTVLSPEIAGIHWWDRKPNEFESDPFDFACSTNPPVKLPGPPVVIPGVAASEGSGLTQKLRIDVFDDFDHLSKEAVPDGSGGNVYPLDPVGEKSMIDGDQTNFGPVFQGQNGFPYVQKDKKLQAIILHPGTFATKNQGASVGFTATEEGDYSISFKFQRANNLLKAGTGVEAQVAWTTGGKVKTIWPGNPQENIPSSEDRPKGGTITQHLAKGDTVRFIVFGIKQGNGERDGTFDATYLSATISK